MKGVLVGLKYVVPWGSLILVGLKYCGYLGIVEMKLQIAKLRKK